MPETYVSISALPEVTALTLDDVFVVVHYEDGVPSMAKVTGANLPIAGPAGPTGPPGADGTGTVTHTAGALTANAIVLGHAAADLTVLGSLGTATQVLHGNASGAPTFGAVALTTDVTGVLPAANGGVPQALATTDTPQFARVGIGAAAHASAALKIAGQYYAPLIDDGNSGTAKMINWNAGNEHYLTETGNCTLTLQNPVDGGRYVLILATGAGSFTPTVPGNVVWIGGTPTFTTTASKYDIVTLLYVLALDVYLAAWGSTASTAGSSLALPVSVPNGGTGLVSYTVGDLLYASGTTALSKLAIGAAGTVLVGGSAPAWSATPTVTSLGVGTTTPAAKLVVSNAGAKGFELDPTITDSIYLSTYDRTPVTGGYIPVTVDCSKFRVRTGGGVNKFTIDASGKVGIGLDLGDTVLGTLHIKQGASGATPAAGSENTVLESNSTCAFSVLCPDANLAQVVFGTPSDNFAALARWDFTNNTLFLGTAHAGGKTAIWVDNAIVIATFDSTGVAFGTNPPSTGLLRLPHASAITARNNVNTVTAALVRFGVGGLTNALQLGDAAFNTRLCTDLNAPATPSDGDVWIEFTGTTPARQLRIAVRDGGVTYVQNIGAAH